MKRLEDFKAYSVALTSNRDRAFYGQMGRFFSSRAVIKELEGPIYDGPGYHWLVVRHGEEIVAFSSWREAAGGVAWFNQTWVHPDHRRQGVYRHLFGLKERLAASAGARVLKGTALTHSKALFEEHGWTVTSTRGPRWTWYEKQIGGAA